MSSLFVQVTVVPAGTVTVCGPNTKLSIFTAVFAAEDWSLAATLPDPASSTSTAISIGAARLAIHTLFLVILSYLSEILFPASFLCLELGGLPKD
jgi:hypothetical protein